ncbi:MAG TPA: AAA family ATPase [Gaiellaceae bacterium]|jgi:class 3 adenylate cyclase/tetratricopeptide (TPR) repeat protein
MLLCPVCGQDNTDVAHFCSACGAALTSEPPREERKVVSVLFADLVGFTSRAEQLDPEDVRAVLAPYWERLRSELEQRGGTVEKFIGDAVMALFGAPAAHDDDPLRAVGAALAIRDWAREEDDLQVRIAVNTGEALVLLGARPAEGEGMAAGDVVNTTARLQAAAPVNGVLVGETTYRATRDVVDYTEHEPVVGKGKSEPIPVWEAVQVRSRLGMDVERATLPLVGRTRELGVIVDAFERARSDREPQLVTLVGVPGIGKSRLVGAFFSHLEADPDLVWWRQGRALPYGDGVSFWAVAEMVKAQAGIAENDPPDACAAKLQASVEQLVADEAERDWVTDHLLPLVGVDHRSGGGDSAPAWRVFFESLAERRPLVMVFEDMHWADDGLLDFIDHLVDWATGVPILVVATARPELLDRRQAWGGGKLNVSTIALTPLSDEEAAQIIHGVLDQAALPAETQQALLERAGGNPLYAEQFARLYTERGSADDLPLPETVQGLIAARLDGLSPEEKRIVQDASVYGKIFWAGAVEADDDALHSLDRKGILRRERRSAVGGETQYAFRHVLVRDVAYGQIPRAARGEKHLRAADWIESLGRADDHAELVAHHLAAAAELGLEVADRARITFRRAGDRARALGAWPAAERYYAQALGSWPVEDEEYPRLVAGLASAQARATGETEQLGAALDALETAGLWEEAAWFAASAAMTVWYASGDPRGFLERGQKLLEGRPASPARAELLAESARIHWFRGEYERAERELAEAAELAPGLGSNELRASVLTTQGVVAMSDGDLDEARRLTDAAIEVAPIGSSSRFRALSNRALFEFAEGDSRAWEPLQAAAVEEAERAGDLPNLRWLEWTTLANAMAFGRWDETLRRAEEQVELGPHYALDSVLYLKAYLLAARNQLDPARTSRDEALALTEKIPDAQSAIPGLLDAGWASLVIGEEELAFRLVEQVLPVILGVRHRSPGATSTHIVLAIRAGRAQDWLELHKRHADTRRVRAALLLLEGRVLEAADAWALVSPHDEAVARLEGARQLAAAGRQSEADVQLERGLAFFRAVGATKMVRDAEGLLSAASSS